MQIGRKLILGALLAGLLVAPAAAWAQRSQLVDHDDARRAVVQRDALPLSRILEIAQREVPGEVLEIELERDDGRLIYEIEILARNGRVRTVELDAATGRVLEVEDDD